MESHPTSSIHFCDRRGNNIDGPTEWVPALIQIAGVQQNWTEVRLTRQVDEYFPVSLRLLNGEIQVIADWPPSAIGHYRLQLSIGDTHIEERIITIQPGKISQEANTRLLEDLEARLPAAIALGLQRNGALTSIKLLPPQESTLAMELVRLRQAVNGSAQRIGLIYILNNLAHDPHQVLSTMELWVPQEQVRRPHPSRLVQAFSRPHNIDASGFPMRLLDSRAQHSVDVYENRLVEIYFRQVYLRLNRLVRMLSLKRHGSSPKDHLLREAKGLRDILNAARRRAAFLDEVTMPSYLPTQITMVLLRHPFYRAALEGYLEFHKSPTVQLEEPALEAPLENLPFLYQVWGTLEVINILLEISEPLGYQVQQQQLAKKESFGVCIQLLPGGIPTVILEHPIHGTIVKAIPERLYRRSANSHQDAFHSATFEQCPDIAVEIYPIGRPPRIYLFDPKYKLENEQYKEGKGDGKPKKEDIDKMHAYRDAIRDAEQQRAVEYAAIMYPGTYQSYDEGIEALQAYPGLEGLLENRLRDVLSTALQV